MSKVRTTVLIKTNAGMLRRALARTNFWSETEIDYIIQAIWEAKF